MDCFKHGALSADVRRTGEPDGPGDLCGNIGKYVSIEIREHDHIENFGGIGHFCRPDVNDPVLILDMRILDRHFIEDLMEESIGHLHNVVFGECRDLLAAVRLGVFECVTHDAFTAWPGDQLEALEHFVGLTVLNTGVEILLILTNDHHVHIWMLCSNKRGVGRAGPYVRIQSEGLPHCHIQALESATLRCGDRCLEKHLGSTQ